MRCSPCGHDNLTGAKFCSACGQPLPASCPACQAALAPGVRFCGACGARVGGGASAEQRITEAETGERRQLTVLLCDLVGSTPLSQQLDAEEWRDVVTRYHATARAAVERFGGHVAQLLGDGLLVYFGWPTAREDDPERAIRAGLAMVEAMGPLSAELALPDGMELRVRVGMHTGAVVVAADGAIFGDTANIAARVQSAAEPATVVITAATQRRVAGVFVVEERGPELLKGVREPVTLYRVVQPSGVRSRLDVAAGRLTRFVGREVELATLVERWERAADGEGQNVLVVGEAGVGKSRLAYQLRERLATTPHTWLECGATPYTEGTPFHPVMALIAQGLAFTTADTPAEKVEKIERGLRDLASSENVALLADFLGLPPPTPFTMNPDVQRRKTMELLAQWNLAISTIQPLVLLVEDLHWCDASSLELLGRIIAQSVMARVLFVATARPEFTPPWPARSNLTTLQLARLTKRQAREMVTTLLGGTVPAETLETLVTRADGVPLYVEELTKAVAEPGAARGAGAIPTTLAGSLMARLDRLATAKEVAQRAAVLGREFGYPLLAAVAGMEDAGLRQGLARLVDAEVVFQRGEPPEATYTFKHALVHEAAYESLLKRTRQQLHGRWSTCCGSSSRSGSKASPNWWRGTPRRRGAATTRSRTTAGRVSERRRAQRTARRSGSSGRRSASLRRGRGVRSATRELSLQLALGGSLSASRGYAHPEREAAYERAAALAAAAGDAPSLDIARNGLAACYFTRGEVERGRALGAAVLAAAEARGDREQVPVGHTNVAIPEHYQGKFASSLAHCERAIALYDPAQRHGQFRELGDAAIGALNFSAWNLWHLGQPDAALARAREAVALAHRLDDQFYLAFALVWETGVHSWRRDVAAQRQRAAEVIALSETQGFPLWLGLGRAVHAAAWVVAGDPGALPEILNGLALSAETGNQSGAPALFALLAEAQQAAGQLADAQGTVATALAAASQTGEPFFDADLHRLDGDLLLATGGTADETAAHYHRALAIAREQGARSFELRAATSLARLWRDQGKRAEARALLAPVYATFTEGFTTRDLIDAKALLAEME